MRSIRWLALSALVCSILSISSVSAYSFPNNNGIFGLPQTMDAEWEDWLAPAIIGGTGGTYV